MVLIALRVLWGCQSCGSTGRSPRLRVSRRRSFAIGRLTAFNGPGVSSSCRLVVSGDVWVAQRAQARRRLADPKSDGYRWERDLLLTPDTFVRPPFAIQVRGLGPFLHQLGLDDRPSDT